MKMHAELKYFAWTAPLFIVIMLLPLVVLAQQTPTQTQNTNGSGNLTYVPLTGLPGITDASDPTQLFNAFFRYGVVIAAMLGVVMVTWGGFKYLTTEAVSGKGEAKEIIREALVGLGLVLISALLLQLINPDILSLKLF